jgi:DNA topoisomerase-1
MRVAQNLYESGKITYMRTDSVNLSDYALKMAREEITKSYGDKYVKTRKYATKTKGAQEAHEAIRPTDLHESTIKAGSDEQRLYELIWKRTIASQMSDAELERTQVKIESSGAEQFFVASGEVIKFDGFLKVYLEGSDDEPGEQEGILPAMKANDRLNLLQMTAKERFSKHPPRYTEASLVKKLEELGIGRPSTYAPTISTIQKREYVVKETRKSEKRTIQLITLASNKITEKKLSENISSEQSKLFPTDIGALVTKFLMQYFDDILDYQFTATVEKEFDEIADGLKEWNQMIKEFYGPFHNKIAETQENSGKFSGEKLLGVDPDTGKNVFVKVGRFGPLAQIGDTESEEKPRFAGLRKNQSIETITLEEALRLFDFPRSLGVLEDEEVTVAIGRFGPYIKFNKGFFSLKKDDDPGSIELERAIEIIRDKQQADKEKLIKKFDEDPDVQLLNGRYGPYLVIKKKNFKLPKGTDPQTLSLEDCYKIAEDPNNTPKKRFVKKKK